MAKQESIEVEGVIKEALPGARFRGYDQFRW